MRILLVGEYSHLHNSLKDGLLQLGHDVVIVGNGDGFKKFPVDYSIESKWSQYGIINSARQIIYRIFSYDFARLESGIRFYFLLPKFKGFDVVQLINEAPIKTVPGLELYLLGKLKKQNKKFYLLSCGADYLSVKFALDKKLRYSILNPYFDNPALKKEYRYIFAYLKKGHKKVHDFVYKNCNAIIASDIDYVLPLRNDPKFAGLIPNPVNISKFENVTNLPSDKIVIFLGINQWNSAQKGIWYFEKALEAIKEKYIDKVDIVIARNLPYNQYIDSYNQCHILLDQVFGYDQGYNALEAMAKGKVVFTGAEKEFYEHYNLTERVAINALPDVGSIVSELSFLIENPEEISRIGLRARAFIEKEHHYISIAEKYLMTWETPVTA